MDFKIIGTITDVNVIAVGPSVRDRKRLRRSYGRGRWRKLKGIATVELEDSSVRVAEVHWYEAHGIGKKEFRLKLPFIE
jgi:hypothetical protein